MKPALGAFLLLFSTLIQADSGFWTASTKAPMDTVYPAVYKALEDNQFWIVYEADMGKFMAKNKANWGDDYNRNQLDAIQSMVFCNIGWTNRMANAHPDMLGVCPLSISLYEKNGETTVTLPRPTVLAAGSPGGTAATESAKALEDRLTTIIGDAVRNVK